MRSSMSASELRDLYSDIRDIEFVNYSEYKRLRTNEEDEYKPQTLWTNMKASIILMQTWVLEKYDQHKGIVIVILSIILGSAFYTATNGWEISTAIFYAANALLGILYMTPGNTTDAADVFTILYYVYGAFFLAGMLGSYVGTLVNNAPEIAAEERRKLLDAEGCTGNDCLDGGERPETFLAHIQAWHSRFLQVLHWEDHRSKYLTTLAVLGWMAVGTAYCMVSEKMEFGSAMFFALSTISGACFVGPQCDGDDDTMCEIGLFREICLLVYVFVGYPLFTILLGQFAALMIERTVRDHETQVISTPLTEKEYNYAANLYENDSVISLGEFTVLELLRLRRITTEDLEMIKAVFDQIDDAKTGNLDKPMLARKKMLRGYGSFDEVDLLREEVEPAPSEPGDELFHYLTENDRANSLPPEITEDMYEAVVDTTLFEGEAEGEVPVDDSMTAGVRQPSVRTSICSSLFPESTRTPDLKTPGEMTQDASSVSSGRVGISRMTFKKYNEVVIPLAVSVVTEGIDTGGDWDLAEYAGDY